MTKETIQSYKKVNIKVMQCLGEMIYVDIFSMHVCSLPILEAFLELNTYHIYTERKKINPCKLKLDSSKWQQWLEL